MDTFWEVQLLGGLRIGRSGRDITHFRTRATSALLTYLAFHRGAAQTRDALIDLLWPNASPGSGRHSLSMTLSFLRQTLESDGVTGGSVVIASRHLVQLNPAAFSTDVAAFEQAFLDSQRARDAERESALLAAIRLYHGALLPGQAEDWVWRERARLADSFFLAARQAIVLYREAGKRGLAQVIARKCITLAPDHEEGYAHLIHLLIEDDLIAEATKHYRHLEKVLAGDGLTPSPALGRILRNVHGKNTRPARLRKAATGRTDIT